MVYDGMVLGHHIVGGVPPDHPDDRVPDYWARGAHVLLYERVDSLPRTSTPQIAKGTSVINITSSAINITSPMTHVNILGTASVTSVGSVPWGQPAGGPQSIQPSPTPVAIQPSGGQKSVQQDLSIGDKREPDDQLLPGESPLKKNKSEGNKVIDTLPSLSSSLLLIKTKLC